MATEHVRSRREFIGLCLGVVGVGVLGACTPAPAGAPVAKSSSAEAPAKAPAAAKGALESLRGQTVNCLVSDHPVITTIQTLVPEFTEATGISVTFDKVHSTALTNKILLTGDSSEYDVLMLQGDSLPSFVHAGLARPIDDLVGDTSLKDPAFTLDMFVPAWLANCKVQDKLYSLPTSMEIGVMYYRKDLYQKYLGGKAPPKTYDEYLADAKALNLKEPDVYGQSWRGTNMQQWGYLIPAFGEKWFDKDWNPQFLTPGHEQICDFMLQAGQYSPPGWNAWDYQEVWTALQQGNIALTVEASVAPTLVDPKISKMTWNELGVTLPPKQPTGFERYNGASGQTLGLAKGARNPQAAYKFIEYTVLPQNDKKLVPKGRVPHVYANYKDEALLKEFPVLDGIRQALDSSMSNLAPDSAFRPRSHAWNAMRSKMEEVYKRWNSGAQPVKEALKDLQSELERLTTEQGLRKA